MPDSDLATLIQKARLFSLITRIANIEQGTDDAVLLGFSLGLRYVSRYPIEAAAMLAELNPPEFESSLRWVVYGPDESDPQAPIN